MVLSGYAYHCAGGETFDRIALEIYNDERRGVDIMCANPEYCHKSVFGGGEILMLPQVTERRSDRYGLPAKAPWKE